MQFHLLMCSLVDRTGGGTRNLGVSGRHSGQRSYPASVYVCLF